MDSSLEVALRKLLKDAEAVLPVVDAPRQRWTLVSESQQELQLVRKESWNLVESSIRSYGAWTKLESYAHAKTLFDADPVFVAAQHAAGYWATFEVIVRELVSACGRMGKRRVRIDVPRATALFRRIRNNFSQTSIRYEAAARLVGVDLRPRKLEGPGGISFLRLTLAERNARQPVIQVPGVAGLEDEQLAYHPTEIRLPITVPVDPSQEGAFFAAHNRAEEVARDVFGRLVGALLLAKAGSVQLGSVRLTGGLPVFYSGRMVPRLEPSAVTLTLNGRDLARLRTAYGLMPSGAGGDKVLGRAIRRFLLGRQRGDLVDKLVDYVIAWEALLLTQESSALAQELSYRFAVNGAALMARCAHLKRLDGYRKFRAAYSTRSTVVHGGDDADRTKALKAGSFGSLHELCSFLEDGFREAAFWLAGKKPADRPYRAKGGWEQLLFA